MKWVLAAGRIRYAAHLDAAAVARISHPQERELPTLWRMEFGETAGWKPALVCLAGAEPLGVKGPRRGDDDNRSRTARWEPQGTHAKGPEANLRP